MTLPPMTTQVAAQRTLNSAVARNLMKQTNDPMCSADPLEQNLACDYGGACRHFLLRDAAL